MNNSIHTESNMSQTFYWLLLGTKPAYCCTIGRGELWVTSALNTASNWYQELVWRSVHQVWVILCFEILPKWDILAYYLAAPTYLLETANMGIRTDSKWCAFSQTVVKLSCWVQYKTCKHCTYCMVNSSSFIIYDWVIRLWLFPWLSWSFNKLLTKWRTVNHSRSDNSAPSHQRGAPQLKAADSFSDNDDSVKSLHFGD